MTDDPGPAASFGRFGRISRARSSDDPSWMAQLDDLTDADVESLLHGTLPAGAESLAPVAEVVLLLRSRALGEPVPAMSPALRSQLAGDAAVTPITRRRSLRRGAKIGVGAAVVAIAGITGAAAASNSLPAQVQDAVSSAADLVGVEVPRSGEPGYDGDETPGGAVPADPGTPGDKEPATPAVPPQPQAVVPPTAADEPGPAPHSSAGGSSPQGNPAPGPVDPQGGPGADSARSPAPPEPPEPDRGAPESDERGGGGGAPAAPPTAAQPPAPSGLPAR